VRRSVAILLAVLGFGAGLVTGIYVKQNMLQNAVLAANATRDQYFLAAMEAAERCPLPQDKWGRQ
jgi:uncharacterized protein HemX